MAYIRLCLVYSTTCSNNCIMDSTTCFYNNTISSRASYIPVSFATTTCYTCSWIYLFVYCPWTRTTFPFSYSVIKAKVLAFLIYATVSKLCSCRDYSIKNRNNISSVNAIKVVLINKFSVLSFLKAVNKSRIA